MKVTLAVLRSKIKQGLKVRGLSKEEIAVVTEAIVDAELMEKKPHGLVRLFMLDDPIHNRKGKPKIMKDQFNYALINGQQSLGHISGEFATNILIRKAKKYGNAIVATTNSDYYSLCGIYARKIAEKNLVGIIMNNGGPAIVVPYGGKQPIFGTNPIAIGIPSQSGPIVLDMATSERAWGNVNMAKLEKKKLPNNVFLTKEGQYTTNPYHAESVAPFGRAKGYGLNFMIEILTGPFVGAKSGLRTKDAYDLGFLFMAFSPKMFTDLGVFQREVKRLIQDVKKSSKMKGVKEIFIPGERSKRNYQKNMKKGFIELDEHIWAKLVAFSKGLDIKKLENLKI